MAACGRVLAALLLVLCAWPMELRAESYEDGLKAFESEDYDRAYRIWQPLADSGDPVAQYSLGKLFERGGGAVRQDFAQAARWYRVAAEQGIAAAQNNLALMHAQGRGLPRDVGQAIELWLAAATQNHPMAQYNLGLAFFRGEGVPKEEREAAAWFRRAADAGLADAQYAMGQMNRLGLVLPKDEAVALAWYKLAGAQGHREAKMQVQLLEAAGLVPQEPGDPAVTPKALAQAGAAAQPAASDGEPQSVVIQPTQAAAQQAATTSAQPESQAMAPAAEEAAGGESKVASPSADLRPVPTPKRRPQSAAQVAALNGNDSDADAAAAPEPAPAAPAPEPAAEEAQELTSTVVNSATAALDASGASAASTGSSVVELNTAVANSAQPAEPAAEAPKPATTEAAAQPEPAAPAPEPAPAQVQTAAKPVQPEAQAAEAPAANGGGIGIWLASENTPDKAMALWPKAQARYPNLLKEAKPAIAKVDWGESGIFYRLLAGPLRSADAARQLCAAMRAKNEDAFCKVMTP